MHPNLDDRTFKTAYDAAGRPVSQLMPGGVSITNTFDAMGRLVSAAGAGAEASTATRSYDYDDAGRLTAITAAGGTNYMEWDDRGLLLSVTGPSGNSSYAYTDDGLLEARTDAAGTTNYDYDDAGRLEEILNPDAGVDVTFEYNELSQVDRILYEGVDTRYRYLQYDPLHRLEYDVLKVDETPVAAEVGRIDYSYDDNGNIVAKDTFGFSGAADNTYVYDWANRLISWEQDDRGGNEALTEYEYDAAGNRTRNGGREFVYDERNRLASDSLGNTYTYTARGTRATQVTPTQTSMTTLTDAFGQVIQQDAPGQQVTYSYDGLGRLLQSGHEYTGLGNDLASDGTTDYVRGPTGGLVGASEGSTDRLVWTDQHADVVGQFTPSSTTLSGSAAYDPLGVVIAATGLIGTLGYQSEYTDALTGRVNMHARWYNPDTGQFDNRDTIAQSPIPMSVNANGYAYGNANPLRYTDPSGHIAVEGNEASAGRRIKIDGRMVNVTTKTYNKIQTRERNLQRQQALAAAGPCNINVNRQYGQGVCAAAPVLKKDETGCPTYRPGRDVEKLIMGGIDKITTGQYCTVLIVGNDGSAYINNMAMSPDMLQGTTPEDLAAAIDREAAKYGGYDADGSDRALITVISLDRALVSAIGVSQRKEQEREAQRQAAECQKDFWCRNADWVGMAVGIVAAIGCGLVTAGAGAVACLVVAGALVNIGTQYLKNNLNSFTDVLKAGAIGAFTGAIDALTGGIGGKIAGSLLAAGAKNLVGGAVKAVANAGAHAFGGAVGGGIAGGAVAAFSSYLETGSVDFDAVVAGAAMGAAFGAVAGAAFSAVPTPKAGGSCPTHSFGAGTLVLMAGGGTKAIEDIKIGDEVVATDPETGETTTQVVTALHHNLDTDLTDLTVIVPADDPTDDAAAVGEGDGGRSTRGPTEQVTLNTTAHHPFWDVETEAWVDAAELTAGRSTLVTPDGYRVEVAAVENFTGEQRMHDLTVANIHTYYVLAGNTPVLVHNCGGSVPGHSTSCACATGGQPRVPSNPYGRTGGPDHQRVMDQVAQDLRDQGLTVRTEVYIETPGGFKPYRFADVVAFDADGLMVSIHQVGRQTAGGIPVMRETKAMSDIWSMLDDGVSILFHPYN
jgi:RHS repeat-associated protein